MSTPIANDSASRRSLFEATLEVIPDIVLIHDEELILFANAACRRFLAAQSPEELEGRPIDAIIHPDAYAAGRERRQLLMESDQCFRDVPLKVIALDGKTKHLVVDAHPLAFDGFRAGMVVALEGAF